MIPKSQASWSCSVDRANDELLITSSLISTAYEAVVYLEVDARTEKIKNTRWEVYRTPSGSVFRFGEIPELTGIGFLSYSSRLFQQTLAPDLRKVLVELISEGIRGIIQSHNFLITKRASQEFANLCNFFLGSCIRFSSVERVAAQLSEVMEEQLVSLRKESLFRRQKSYHIFTKPDGSLWASAGFADAYHELLLTVSFSQSCEVADISGGFLRSPYNGCHEGLELLPRLKGKNLSEMRKKEIADLVGGSAGCTHILEMCYDLGLALSAAKTQL